MSYEERLAFYQQVAKASGSSGGNTGGTSAASPNKTDAEVLAAKIQGRKDTDAALAYADNKRNTLSHKWADYNYGENLKQATEAASHDNSAGWQQRKDRANAPNLAEAEEAMSAYREAVEKENKVRSTKELVEKNNPGEAALLGSYFDTEISKAEQERNNLAAILADYGIATNGTQIYADDFYKKYFGNFADEARASGASTELDTSKFFSGSINPLKGNLEKSRQMTADEIQMYNYLARLDEANGTNRADVYRRYMEGVLNQRQGQARADEILAMNKGNGRGLLMGAEAFKAGASGTLNDLIATVTGGTSQNSASEYAAAALRNDMVERGKNTLFFDAAQSVGGMAPGVAAGLVNPYLGAATFGVTSGASGYQQKLAEGWSEQDAMAYGTLVGISEAALSKVLGGISALGGDKAGIFTKLTSKINSAISRAVMNGAGRALSEANEEAIQTYIEPALVSIIKSVDYDAPDAEEVIHNALIGAITSMGLGAPEVASDILKGSPASPQNAVNASSPASREITPPTAQNAGQTASGELNSQELRSAPTDVTISPNNNNVVRAIEMVRRGASPSEIFNETGLVKLGNGNLIDQSTGDIVWRADNGSKGSVEGNNAIQQTEGLSEAGAVDNDGRGTVGIRGQEDGQNRATALTAEQRRRATGEIAPVISSDPDSMAALFVEEYGSEEALADALIDAYLDGEVALEQWVDALGASVVERVKSVVDNISRPTDNAATTAETTMGSGPARERSMSEGVRTNEANEAELRQSFEEAPEMYTQLTNTEVQAKADAILAKGFEAARSEVEQAVGRAKSGMKLAPEYAVAAQAVANEMTRNGDVTAARNLMSDVLAEFTAAGQFAQIGRLLRQADPATKAMTIQKLVEKLNGELSSRQKAKNVKRGVGNNKGKIFVSEELLNRFATAPDEATRNAIMGEIEQTIADQIPATFRDKFTAMRYLNMLGNFKTQGRNLAGNAIMAATAAAKRRAQAAAELGAALATNGKYERSTSLFVSRDLRKAAAADFANVENAAMGEAKYSDAGRQIAQGIRDKQKIFDSKFLEGYRKKTNWAMQAGDRIFLKFHYADALAGYLQAHGVTNIAEASPELLNNARTFAIKEAQEATFRDDNAVSEAVVNFGRGTKLEVLNVIADGIMPFRKTPANVAVRAVEYSPVGLLKAATVDAYRASQGDISPADVINNAAKGATGTALAVAGYLLAQAGLAKGSEEDDELASFQKNQGEMDYSIKVGDTYVSLSQFAPMAVPFFMGVKLQEIIEAQEGAISLDSVSKLLGAITDPMLEMSMLSGVNDAFSNLSSVSGDSDALPQLVANSMISYFSQGLTNSLLGQFEQATEENRQTTYTSNKTDLDKFLGKTQYKVGQLAAKTPGVDYHQQDYVDAWGRTQSNGNIVERALNAFINPTYGSKDRSTEVDAELERLYRDNKDTEDFPNVFPQKRSRSETYGDGKVMTADEYLQFSKDSGQMKLELVSEFISSDEYKQLDDKHRADVISDLYSLADDRALKKIKDKNGVESKSDWDKVATLKDPVDYILADTLLSEAKARKDTASYDAIDALIQSGVDSDAAKLLGESNVNYDKLVYAAGKNIGSEEWYNTKDAIKAVEDTLGDSNIVPAIAVSKSVKGDDAAKLNALEAHLIPADGGKRNATVRRFEAAIKSNISFDDWATFEATIKDVDPNNSVGKQDIENAINKLHSQGILAEVTSSQAYNIYKENSGDENIIDVYDKEYGEKNPVVEKDSASYLDYVLGIK